MFATNDLYLSLDKAVHKSSERMTSSLKKGTFQEHILSNGSIPFTTKQDDYLMGYARMLRSRNCRYIMMCEGTEQ